MTTVQSERDEQVRAHDELVDKAASLYDMHCTATARLAKVRWLWHVQL